VRQLIVPKPVLVPVAPGTVFYVPNGAGGLEAPEDLTEAEIAALTPMIAARSDELLAFQGTLSLEAQDDLIRGMPVPLSTPPLPDGINLADGPAILAMGADCGALFRATTETTRLLQFRADNVARIALLKEMLKAEGDKTGLVAGDPAPPSEFQYSVPKRAYVILEWDMPSAKRRTLDDFGSADPVHSEISEIRPARIVSD